jgi:putative glutamine amidotransferase
VDRVGDGLIVTGHSADGIIEAFEHADGWLVGVQWHPEDTAGDDDAMQRLFDSFVAVARRYVTA